MIWIKTKKFSSYQYDENFISSRLNELIDLKIAVEDSFKNKRTNDRWLTDSTQAILFMSVHMSLILVALIAAFYAHYETKEIINYSVFVSTSSKIVIVVCLFWLLLILNGLWGSSWLPIVIVDFLLIGILGFVTSLPFIICEANFALDRNYPVVHKQKVIYKICKLKCKGIGGRKNSTRVHYYPLTNQQCDGESARQATLDSYNYLSTRCYISSSFILRLSVEPWVAEQSGPFEFDVTPANYDNTKVGDKLYVLSNKGYFGFSWVDSKKIFTPAE